MLKSSSAWPSCGGRLVQRGTICEECGAKFCWRCGDYVPGETCLSCRVAYPGPNVGADRWLGFLKSARHLALFAKLTFAGLFIGYGHNGLRLARHLTPDAASGPSSAESPWPATQQTYVTARERPETVVLSASEASSSGARRCLVDGRRGGGATERGAAGPSVPPTGGLMQKNQMLR